MIIWIDNREKNPLVFPQDYIKKRRVVKMSYGDYGCTINGNKCPIMFERKSKADLWGTLGSTKAKHERFKREIARCHKAGHQLIVIVERSVTDILKGHSFRKGGKVIKCKVGGLALFRTINTFEEKYAVRFIFCRDRDEMSTTIAERFLAWGKLQ